ncbi:MAG: C40 family peptidase, partial [Clostridia bacterium]|nr:C40 family peptidase [Clostridia bacterium]
MKKHIIFAISVALILLLGLTAVFLLTANVTVDFAFSHPEGVTLHPGSDTVYEFTIKNNSIFPKTVKITDPSDALFTEGKVEKEIKVGGKKTEKIVYTLKTADDTELVGKIIKGRTIKVNEQNFNVSEVFIERTFNEWDQRKMRLAILAHESAPVENATLVKWIYTVALSKAASLEGEPSEILSRIFEPEKAVSSGEKAEINAEEITPASVSTIQMVAPRLYFSEHIAEEAKALLKGEPLALKDASFVTGDVFVTDEKMYIFDGEKFWEMKKNGMVKASVEEIKKGTYSRWAVLRPSMAIKNINYSTPYSKEGFSEKELAVVATAEAFLLRGMRYQYDDTRFIPNGPFRWQIRANEPEDATLQNWGYSNCAAFALDCNRFGIDYKTNLYSTYDIVHLKPISSFVYEPTGKETEEEKKKIEEEFFASLRPGDIIVIRRKNGSGHAMLYVGCGDIIHSSGGNYNYTKGTETYEPTVRFMRALDLFREETYPTSYVFTMLTKIAVLRPAMKEETAVTENSKARLQNMEGIVAEKLSSHNKANT